MTARAPADVPWPNRPRTEVELAADVLARLLRHGVIPLGMRAEATRLVGLQQAEVTEALERKALWRPPRRIDAQAHPSSPARPRPLEAPSSLPAPTPARRPLAGPPQPPPRVRPGRKRRIAPNGDLWCIGCEEFHPEDQFPLRSDRLGSGARKSRCRAALSRDAAARYLSVEKREALEAARIRFVIDEHSALLGVACADCGAALAAGDAVHVDGAPRHDACPAAR